MFSGIDEKFFGFCTSRDGLSEGARDHLESYGGQAYKIIADGALDAAGIHLNQ